MLVCKESNGAAFPKGNDKHYNPLDVVGTDTFVANKKIKAIGGTKYVQVYNDDASGLTRVFKMKKKSEFITTLRKFCVQVGVPKVLRHDNALEQISKEVNEFCEKHHIKRQLTCYHSSLQNALAERRIYTLENIARTLILHMRVPTRFFFYALKTAAHLLCRRPDTVRKKSPLEICTGEKPSIAHLKVFGCLAFISIPVQHRKFGKMSPSADKGIFLGYSIKRKGWTIFNINTRAIVKVRSASYLEHIPGSDYLVGDYGEDYEILGKYLNRIAVPDFVKDAECSSDDDYSSKSDDEDNTVQLGPLKVDRGSPNEEDDATLEQLVPAEPDITLPPPGCGAVLEDEDMERESYAGSASNDSERISLPPLVICEPLSSTRRSLRRKIPSVRLNPQEYAMCGSMYKRLPHGHEPTSIFQALNGEDGPKWMESLCEELQSILKNETWTAHNVNQPEIQQFLHSNRLVSMKWVFKVKRDAEGQISRYKTRLVARGFSQIPGQDFDQTYAPVARLETIRTIIAIAALKNYKIKQMDVKSAYLNSSLERRIYCSPPEGYEGILLKTQKGQVSTPFPHVLELHKALYGLKQAAYLWNQLLTNFLKSIGFEQTESDTCVFVGSASHFKGKVILVCYVDDINCAHEQDDDWDFIEQRFKQEFKMQTSSVMEWFLGVSLKQDVDRGEITLNQSQYIEDMLTQYGMKQAYAVATPATLDDLSRDPPRTQKEEEEAPEIPYQNLVGALLYLVRCTRPDIAFIVRKLSQFNLCYGQRHWTAAKRVLRYLQGTKTLSVLYRRNGDDQLYGMSDSDWGKDKDNSKSVSGYIFFLGGAPISWNSKAQTSIAMSTFEAELYALIEAAKEATFLRKLLQDVGYIQKNASATPVYCDNQSVIAVVNGYGTGSHRKVKHIPMRINFLKELIANNIITVKYIHTDRNHADLFTKPLARKHFQSHVSTLLKEQPEESSQVNNRVGDL